MGNMAVAQSGGPTAAINASLCGVIEAALEKGVKLYGAENGIKGIFEDRLVLLNDYFAEEKNRSLLKTTPAAFLGSCRYKLPETEGKNEVYEEIFDYFEKKDITHLVYIGGNDSMDTVAKLSSYANKFGKNLKTVGVPKTVDNDLAGTDHTPGYGSAAKYVAATVKEIDRDSAVYLEKSVTIVEIMGRNAGWLTAASALARCETSNAPHLIYLPEAPVSKEKILDDIEKCGERNIIVAISEGIKDENGKYFCESEAGAHDIFGHVQLAGAAGVVAGFVKEHFGWKTRGIELNVPQRCGGHFTSLIDLNEAEKIGFFAANSAFAGKSGIVPGFLRVGDYEVEIVENNVTSAANFEKTMPPEYISENGNDVTAEFIKYARPLIMGEAQILTENGLPKHISLSILRNGEKNGK